MGFQSGLLAAAGSIAGAVGSVTKTLKQRQDDQNTKVKQQQEAMKTQRRNFMDYLKNIELQGGGKVGELPPKMQQVIAKQYSKQERKSIMDLQDKEKKDGTK